MAEPIQFFDVQPASGGGIAGPRLNASLTLVLGVGLCFTDAAGKFYRLALVVDANGNAVLDGNGAPSLSIQQVNV